jgi:hypothetical protein
MQINKEEERRRWIENNWIRSTDLLMIDSKWEWKRRRFLKREKEKRNIWIERRTWTTELI